MKNKLAAFVLAVLMIFSVATFATGPLVGVGIAPVTNGNSMLTFGYDFGGINLEVQKDDLSTPFGFWNSAIVWTPEISNGFGYRAGGKLTMDYVWVTPTTGRLQYDQFAFLLGLYKTWGACQLYGDVNIAPRGVGQLQVLPILGVNFLFGNIFQAEVI